MIFSPSSTMTYSTCPKLWHLEQAGWKPVALGKVDIAAAIGSGIGAGLEAFNQALLGRVDSLTAESVGLIAASATRAQLQHGIDAGRVLPADLEPNADQAPEQARMAAQVYAAKNPIPSDWQLIDAEQQLVDHGNARPDALFMTPTGLCVLDYKSKVQLSAYYRDRFFAEFETRWQMYHYVWSLRQCGYDVASFAACLIVIEPKPKFWVREYPVDEEYLEEWNRTAFNLWHDMDRVKEGIENLPNYTPPMAPDHYTRYGRCPMYDWCFLHKGGHTVNMQYVKVEREQR